MAGENQTKNFIRKKFEQYDNDSLIDMINYENLTWNILIPKEYIIAKPWVLEQKISWMGFKMTEGIHCTQRYDVQEQILIDKELGRFEVRCPRRDRRDRQKLAWSDG